MGTARLGAFIEMQMVLLIVLAVVVVAMLIAAYLASKTWHWGHVSLVLGVFFSGVLYMVLAAETIRIHHVYRSAINTNGSQLTELTVDNEALSHGTDDSQVTNRLNNKLQGVEGPIQGIANLEHELQMLARLRGRVWRGADPIGNVSPATGEVTLELPRPAPPLEDPALAVDPAAPPPPPAGPGQPPTAGIEKGMILFAFEVGPPTPQNPSGPQYVGEFQVTSVNPPSQIKMVPVLWYSWPQRQKARLGAASQRSFWHLHETMPPDQWELLAVEREGQEGGLPAARLQQLLPQASLREYLHHGERVTAEDPEERRRAFSEAGDRLTADEAAAAEQRGETVVYRYERELRDYAYLFQVYAQQRARKLAEIEAAQNDIQRLENALAVAEEQRQFRTQQIQRLRDDLQGFVQERDVVQQYRDQVQQQLAAAQAMLEETLANNQSLAAQLARAQLEIQASLDSPLEPTPAEGASELSVVEPL